MFEFLTPKTVDEALVMLQEKQDARVLAGGTDLLVLLRNKAITCEQMVDVKKIPELSVFAYGADGLEIGGAVTCNQIMEADFLDEGHKVLQQAAATLANTLLRNRATLVGNICNASPGGDMIPACLVLNARLVVAGKNGNREIPLKEFFTGVKKTVLARDEMVIKVVFPREDGRGEFLKKRRIRGHDLAQVGVAGFWGKDGLLRIACSAVAPTPIVLDDFGALSADQLAAQKDAIVDKVAAAASPISDVRSTKEYRLAMLRLFTGRIIDAFAGGTEVVR